MEPNQKPKIDEQVEEVAEAADQTVGEKPATTQDTEKSSETQSSTSSVDKSVSSESAGEESKPETSSQRPTAGPSDQAKWYIVHTYSGHENKVTKSIKQRVQSLGFENRVFDIIVPTRNTIKVSQGKKETVKEKIFPGYVLVKMILDDESWLLIRTTQGVTAFIGTGNKPTPISDKEVEAIQKFMDAEEPLYKTAFTIGEAVKIVDGPFSDFLGTIDAIDEARGKLKVLVSIFGRETPVELDFLQVNKL